MDFTRRSRFPAFESRARVGEATHRGQRGGHGSRPVVAVEWAPRARERARGACLGAKSERRKASVERPRVDPRAFGARAHEVRRARSGLYAPGSTPARARPMSFNAFDARRRASRSDVTRHCRWNSCFAALSQLFDSRSRASVDRSACAQSENREKERNRVFLSTRAHARALSARPPRAADETPTPRVVVNQKPPHHIVAHPPSPISARPRSPPAPSCPPACWT